MSEPRELVLIADDDEDIVRFVEVNLRLEGFDVQTVSDGEAALSTAFEAAPDLILLDVMMPRLDGFQVCQRLRADARTKHTCVIMLTAKSLSADKVLGLTAGADDYMIKPFDPIELVARVKSALRRSREMRGLNPLTQLPGNVEVQEEVARRVEDGTTFALLYIDLDNFKAYNDHYGFLRGDEALKTVARCARTAVEEHGSLDSFVGHIGGDDFVAIVEGDAAQTVAKSIIACFDDLVPDLYDPADREAGGIEITDRRGELHRFPLLSVSIGIATNAHRPITSHWEASEIAAEMKQFAKRESGSSFAIDRRRAPEGSTGPDGDRRGDHGVRN